MRSPVTETEMWAGSHYVELLDPQPESICLADIANNLSRIIRYNGAAGITISVACHSMLAYRIAHESGIRDQLLLATIMMHDAAEAYVGDAIRAVKKAVPGICVLEDGLFRVIARKYQLIFPMPPEVKRFDDLALAKEKQMFLPNVGDWPRLPKAPEVRDRSWHCGSTLAALRYFRLAVLLTGAEE